MNAMVLPDCNSYGQHHSAALTFIKSFSIILPCHSESVEESVLPETVCYCVFERDASIPVGTTALQKL